MAAQPRIHSLSAPRRLHAPFRTSRRDEDGGPHPRNRFTHARNCVTTCNCVPDGLPRGQSWIIPLPHRGNSRSSRGHHDQHPDTVGYTATRKLADLISQNCWRTCPARTKSSLPRTAITTWGMATPNSLAAVSKRAAPPDRMPRSTGPGRTRCGPVFPRHRTVRGVNLAMTEASPQRHQCAGCQDPKKRISRLSPAALDEYLAAVRGCARRRVSGLCAMSWWF